MFRSLLSLFLRPSPASGIPARRIEAAIVSRSEKDMGYRWGGPNYWRG